MMLGCERSGSTKGSSVEEPEPALVRAAMAGDLAAFERLVRLYQAHVWRFLRHLLGDAALAEDVAQETFLRLYQRLPSFAWRSKFSTWVFRVARNAGIDALRSRRRQDRLLQALPPPAPGPSLDARAEVLAAVASLTPKLREALLLVEVFGFTYREAAEVLGVPDGTVKSRVFQARVRLAAWRDEEGRAGEL
jgi:RNA polymerase sigma-70 factor, ECF subfamily